MHSARCNLRTDVGWKPFVESWRVAKLNKHVATRRYVCGVGQRSRWILWLRARSTCSSRTSSRRISVLHVLHVLHLVEGNIEQLRKNFAFTCPILDMGFACPYKFSLLRAL